MNPNVVNIGALAGKLTIENSNLSRDNKEWAKAGIDVLKEFISSTQQPQSGNSLAVYGFSFESIKDIKHIAAQCSVDKIVLFPVFFSNGGYNIYIRVHGIDSYKIFQYVNVIPLNNAQKKEMDVLLHLEQEYGVVIYEKNI